MTSESRNALVLVGGGARAAYQAGALKGLAEILGPEHAKDGPLFSIISGISAGAINGAFLASRAHRMQEGIHELYQLWDGIQVGHVLRTNLPSLAMIGLRWVWDLVLGGLRPQRVRSTHLIDTTPLQEFLLRHIDFGAVEENIRRGVLHGLSVSATSYRTGTAINFYDGHQGIEPWTRSSRLGWRMPIRLEHVLASASIPILFRPVAIDGAEYGDGSIRLATPLSPAVHMGAKKLIAISVRHQRSLETTNHINKAAGVGSPVAIADIVGVMLNAAFLDGLDADVERLERINQTIEIMDEEQRLRHPEKLRKIPILVLRPSRDLGAMASDQYRRFPRTLRYLMRGIGASREGGWDFLSYLAFDSSYSRRLLELGYLDALARKDAIRQFFE